MSARTETETPETLAMHARALYAGASATARWKQSLRPYICPFHSLIENVPRSATVLDVGSGEGLFLLLLARLGRIEGGLGFDANQRAIDVASGVARRHGFSTLTFQHRDALATWPDVKFDLVSVVDLMHHVPVDAQRELIEKAVEHVRPGGYLLYKDMVARPLWRAWANRVHDLILAREWIHYVDIQDVQSWARSRGASTQTQGASNMLWYGHEWCVLKCGC